MNGNDIWKAHQEQRAANPEYTHFKDEEMRMLNFINDKIPAGSFRDSAERDFL